MNLREVDIKLLGYGLIVAATFIFVVAFSNIQDKNGNYAEKNRIKYGENNNEH